MASGPCPPHATTCPEETAAGGTPALGNDRAPRPGTFAAKILLHSREADLLVQQLLLLAVLALGHHPPQPLEVFAAVAAAELVDLVLAERAGTTRASGGHRPLWGNCRSLEPQEAQ